MKLQDEIRILKKPGVAIGLAHWVAKGIGLNYLKVIFKIGLKF